MCSTWTSSGTWFSIFFFSFFSWEQGLTGGSLTKRQRHKDAGTETEEREKRTSPYFFRFQFRQIPQGVCQVYLLLLFLLLQGSEVVAFVL